MHKTLFLQKTLLAVVDPSFETGFNQLTKAKMELGA